MEDRPHLRLLADRVGILPAYIDVDNVRRVTRNATRMALLAAMGLDASTEGAAAQTLAKLERLDRQHLLPPLCVVQGEQRQPRRVRLTIPGHERAPIHWHIELREEGGASHIAKGCSKSRSAGGSRTRDRTILVPLPADPPAGYHTLRVTVELPKRVLQAQQSLIVSPGRCTPLSERVGEGRKFGLWTNLYTALGNRNWGVGDLTDLGELVREAARHGAAFVGLNPLHALRNRGDRISPYLPVSRLFRNLLYLDMEAIPEFAQCRDARARFESPAFRTDLAQARAARYVEYERVAALKIEILRLLHRSFVERHASGASDRSRAYTEYVTAQGQALIDFATFLALDNQLTERGEGGAGWRDWPIAYRTAHSPEVEAFRAAHRHEVDFHCYVQFELDRQLATAADEAQRAGMRIGLYPDLALGSAADGSDAWAFPDLFLKGVEVGAPPDPYCQAGQTWGFPPLDPHRLKARRYDYWIGLLRSSLAHAGMLRIDHVMGLFRQFWVPDGCPPTDGAYVRYPASDLLAILALESQRHRAVIVGEDLGTVPRELPAILARWGILSSRVLYFERNRRGTFRPAASYSRRALATATTHDHPPLAGFWTGRDLDIRHEIGLIRLSAELEEARTERERTRSALLRRLVAEGLWSDAKSGAAEELSVAVHAFLARTPCPLVGISLDDLAGETEPINLPGVKLTHYRSWSRRMQRSLRDILADSAVRSVLKHIQATLETPQVYWQEERAENA